MKLKDGRILLDEEGILSFLPGKAIKIWAGGKPSRFCCPDSCTGKGNIAFKLDAGVLNLHITEMDIKEIIKHGANVYNIGDIIVKKLDFTFIPFSDCELQKLSITFDFMHMHSELWETAKKSFHWIPNIKTEEDHVAGQHVFRSPAVIVSVPGYCAVLIPDLLSIAERPDVGRYLDLGFFEKDMGKDIPCAPFLEYGISSIVTDGHVYYKRGTGSYSVDNSGIRLSLYLLLLKNIPEMKIPGLVASFHWSAFASSFEGKLLPQTLPFYKYAEYGNGMALQYLWEPGPVRDSGGIVLTTFRRPDGVVRGREYADDIWFHSWFNNMRTAMELAEFGIQMGKPGWTRKAFAIARCLVAAPQKEGIFPTIYAPRDGGWVLSSAQGGGTHLYSIPDCSWACLWLRKFTIEYGKVDGAEAFLSRFRSFLYKYRNASGGFPCWMYADTLKNDPRLNDSASGALAVWFLGEELLAGAVTGEEYDAVFSAVTEGADFLIDKVLSRQRFEDFELYYSCSEKPLDFYDKYTEMFGQNTLAIQWCAESFRCAYLLTRCEKYLEAGLFCLGLLSLYQQVWDAPFLDFYTFGGFGVMNTDGEWNDARQAQFAETYMNYYDLTGNFEFIKRAIAAARASFALMVIYENEKVCPINYRGNAMSFEVHGGSAENYGHSGKNARSGSSGFHWGTGSALVTAARIKKRYGDLIIDLSSKEAAGIDGIAVRDVSFSSNIIDMKLETLQEIKDIKITLKTGGVATGAGIPEIRINGNPVKFESIKAVLL